VLCCCGCSTHSNVIYDDDDDDDSYVNGWDGATGLVYLLVTANVPTAYLCMKYVDSMAKAMIQAIAVIAVRPHSVRHQGGGGHIIIICMYLSVYVCNI
jgi:hypothetical protein